MHAEHAMEVPQDLWTFSVEANVIKASNYLTWEAFEGGQHEEPSTPYITETGARTFDAALSDDADILGLGETTSVVMHPSMYASCLLLLGLGRSSVLFEWSEEKMYFLPTLPSMRMSGCSYALTQSHLQTFMDCGNSIRLLQGFVDQAYASSKSPGYIALAKAVSTLLETLQSTLHVTSLSGKSVLQLQAIFRPAEAVLTSFRDIVSSVPSTASDEALLSVLFQEAQRVENRAQWMKDVLLEVLSLASAPWLEFASSWMGLRREIGLQITKFGVGKSFVKVDSMSWIDEQGTDTHEAEFVFDHSLMPSFMAPQDASVLFETGKSLQFLRTHHPDDPLSHTDVIEGADPPMLDWKFSWHDIDALESKALQYEKDLKAAIAYCHAKPAAAPHEFVHEDGRGQIFELYGRPEEEMQAHVLTSIESLNMPLVEMNSSNPDRLSRMIKLHLGRGLPHSESDTTFAPPVSLTPVLSFGPIISTQARVINATCMRLFFKSHALRKHLDLQRRFHLMDDGVFSSRLASALFDPELETAERQAGVARSGGIMGLRLGGRDTWPPASSELRLALMGVLTESYNMQSSKDHNGRAQVGHNRELPGDLSFAVRDMSPDEIQKCMNPDSIEALDFLRLSYKPPAPLEAIITPMSLYKYDLLFKLLLRVTRMLYTVGQLFRDATDRTSYWQGIDPVAQRFRIEAHHFITSICSYFLDTGVGATWKIFERKLDEVEGLLDDEEGSSRIGQHDGLNQLREYHEHVLDRITFALFLRRRQQPVMKLLQDIFTSILHFAKYSRSRALGLTRNGGADEEVRQMYLQFRKQVGVFITVCRGLSEKKGYGEKSVTGLKSHSESSLFGTDDLMEENTVVHLLVKLEMSDYYSQAHDQR